jgi:diguanylate cyclase (GGDEF)-like protein/PAS domain S-box-containing protein
MLSVAELLRTMTIDSPLRRLIEKLTQVTALDDASELSRRLANIAAQAQADADDLRATLEIVERRFEATFSQAPVGIAHVAPDGNFLRVNEQFARITGHSVDALMQYGFQQITYPDDLASDLAHVERLLSGADNRYVMEKRYLRPDASIVWVNLTVALTHDASGAPDFFVAVIEDKSEIKRAHSEAMRDPLTGLLNRRGFLDRATRALKRAARAQHAMGLVYLDLDGFKGVNDGRGHAVGDVCLTEVARMIETVTRPEDALARMGGDEFTILMPHLSIEQAGEVAERLRAAVEQYRPAGHQSISGSFGVVSMIPDRDTTVEHLVVLADHAMLCAKREGKNRVRCG